jgi:murein DD-endopeptidase MepM/ murein hydrolase activator NlpD
VRKTTPTVEPSAPEERELFLNWYKIHYPNTAVQFTNSPPIQKPQPSFAYTHWPTQHRTITQAFGANPKDYLQFGWTGGHEGIDIRAPLNTAVYAPAAGTITRIENLTETGIPSNYGWHIHLDHGNGYTTILAHLHGQQIVFTIGDHVTAGQHIAHSGNTGNTTGPHLHLSLLQANAQTPGFPPGYIDPTPFIEHLRRNNA